MTPSIIPFSPDDFRVNVFNITCKATPTKLLNADPRRRYFNLVTVGLASSTNPMIFFGGNPATNAGIPVIATLSAEYTWIKHYNLVCQEVWESGFNANVVICAIEVIYQPSDKKGAYDATRKPETLAAKIRRLAGLEWSGGKFSNGNTSPQSETPHIFMGRHQ